MRDEAEDLVDKLQDEADVLKADYARAVMAIAEARGLAAAAVNQGEWVQPSELEAALGISGLEGPGTQKGPGTQ